MKEIRSVCDIKTGQKLFSHWLACRRQEHRKRMLIRFINRSRKHHTPHAQGKTERTSQQHWQRISCLFDSRRCFSWTKYNFHFLFSASWPQLLQISIRQNGYCKEIGLFFKLMDNFQRSFPYLDTWIIPRYGAVVLKVRTF